MENGTKVRIIKVLGSRPRTVTVTGNEVHAMDTAQQITKEPGTTSVKLFDGPFVGASRLYTWSASRKEPPKDLPDRHWRTCVRVRYGWKSDEIALLGTHAEALASAEKLAAEKGVTRVRLFDGFAFITPLLKEIVNPEK